MNLKNSKAIKFLSMLLATLTLTTCLFSCENTPQGPAYTGSDSTSTSSSDTTPADTTEPEYMEVALPEFDFSKEDLSSFIVLPADLFTRDYKEGLTLLGAPSDKDVEKEINAALKSLATQKEAGADAVVEDGDTVVMDYVGKLDGVEFLGGTASDSKHDISIENSSFIDGFDRGLLGMKVGETKDLNLTFPDPYPNNSELAGKAVVFTVTIDKIIKYEIPELTDKLIADNEKFFGEDIKTASEYRAEIKNSLTEYNKQQDENKIMEAAWKYTTEKTEFKSYPDGLLDGYIEAFYAEYYNMAISNGMTIEQLAQEEGYISVDEFKKDVITESAKNYVNERIILYYACKISDIVITDEDARAEAEAEYKEVIEPNLSIYTQYYGIKDLDSYIEYSGGIEVFRENTMFVHLIYKITGLEMPDLDTDKAE